MNDIVLTNFLANNTNSRTSEIKVDLYEKLYKQRTEGGNRVVKSNANSKLFLFERNALDYFVTNYNSKAYKNLSIDENGILTYELFDQANLSDQDMKISIVFQLKD